METCNGKSKIDFPKLPKVCLSLKMSDAKRQNLELLLLASQFSKDVDFAIEVRDLL